MDSSSGIRELNEQVETLNDWLSAPMGADEDIIQRVRSIISKVEKACGAVEEAKRVAGEDREAAAKDRAAATNALEEAKRAATDEREAAAEERAAAKQDRIAARDDRAAARDDRAAARDDRAAARDDRVTARDDRVVAKEDRVSAAEERKEIQELRGELERREGQIQGVLDVRGQIAGLRAEAAAGTTAVKTASEHAVNALTTLTTTINNIRLEAGSSPPKKRRRSVGPTGSLDRETGPATPSPGRAISPSARRALGSPQLPPRGSSRQATTTSSSQVRSPGTTLTPGGLLPSVPRTSVGSSSQMGGQTTGNNNNAMDPAGLAVASEEMKSIWRQILLPSNWTSADSDTLLRIFTEAKERTGGKNGRYWPQQAMNNRAKRVEDRGEFCLNRDLHRAKAKWDSPDDVQKPCTACKAGDGLCVDIVFPGPVPGPYIHNAKGKRWELMKRDP